MQPFKPGEDDTYHITISRDQTISSLRSQYGYNVNLSPSLNLACYNLSTPHALSGADMGPQQAAYIVQTDMKLYCKGSVHHGNAYSY